HLFPGPAHRLPGRRQTEASHPEPVARLGPDCIATTRVPLRFPVRPEPWHSTICRDQCCRDRTIANLPRQGFLRWRNRCQFARRPASGVLAESPGPALPQAGRRSLALSSSGPRIAELCSETLFPVFVVSRVGLNFIHFPAPKAT